MDAAQEQHPTKFDDGPLLTDTEVAGFCGFSVACVRRWRLHQMGPRFLKIHAFSVRYRKQDVEAWLAQQQLTGGEQNS